MSVNYDIDVNMLSTMCPLYQESINNSNGVISNTEYSVDEEDAILKITQSDFKSNVDNAITSLTSILSQEKNYFTNKYGFDVYKSLMTIRNNYLSTISSSQTSANCNVADTKLSNLKTEIDNTDYTEILNVHKKNKETYNKQITNLFNRHSLHNREMEYRNDESNKMGDINRYLNILFILIILTMLIYQLIVNRPHVIQYWWVYALLLLFPYVIYPFIFYYVNRLYLYLKDQMTINVDPNAFVNKKEV